MGSSKKSKDKDRDRDRKRDKEKRHDKERYRKRSRSRDRDERHDKKDRKEYRDSDNERKKSRAEDVDDLLEYAMQESRNDELITHQQSSEGVGAGGSGDSLSIEETNKIRAKLGLKPLQVDDQSENPEEKKTSLLDDVHVPPENIADKQLQEKMRRKLEEIRQKRRIHQKLTKVKPLGEENSDDESAGAWVKKSRKKGVEKEMAEKTAKMLEEMDAEFGVGDLINQEYGSIRQKSYTSKDLRGLTIEHDQTSFKEGKTTILTLKDQGILDDEGDTLYNINMGDFEKANKNVELRKKKPSYQPYDNVDENDLFKVQGVLDKYDEEIEGEKKKSFALESGGRFDSREDDLEKIKARLRNEMVSLEMAKPKLASEYYSEEEMLKFKKPKKKRKIRKREVLKADALESITGSAAATSDHGSRTTKARPKNEEQTNYGEEAMEIAPNIDQDNEENYYNQEPQDNNFVFEDDEAQLELEVALQRSRLAKKKKTIIIGVEKVVQELSAAAKKEQPKDNDEASIVIDSTSEFCRTLGEIPTYGASGNREEEEEEEENEAEAEWQMDIDRPSKEPQGGWEWVKEQEEKKRLDANKLEEESRVLDEEPIVGSGVAAALLLASKKGLLNAPGKHRRDDKFVAELSSVGIIDEEKMGGDGKDRIRNRDRDHDRYRVEKEGYVPKVKLDYVDEHGRQMTPKEAFRYLSHRFHGKMPAKMKTEKRAKKVQEDTAMQKMSSVDTPLNTAALLKDKQREAQSPYLILSGGGNTFSAGAPISKKK